MEGQGYRVGVGEGRGWPSRAAVGPPITVYKGCNGGSTGFEKVGPLAQVLGLGFGGGQRRGGTTCRVLLGPRFPWLATSSPPLPPGGGCSAWKGRNGEQKAPSERRLTCQEEDSNLGHAMRQCTEIPLGHTASDLYGGPGVQGWCRGGARLVCQGGRGADQCAVQGRKWWERGV